MNRKQTIKNLTALVVIMNVLSFFMMIWKINPELNVASYIVFALSFIYICVFIYANNIYKAKRSIGRRVESVIKHFMLFVGIYTTEIFAISFIKLDLGYMALVDLVMIIFGLIITAYAAETIVKIY